ncbi:Gag-Pol polyprotein [Sesamum angolense]|uniref:Gag-Pol polyprotein n=1 Tax=Sesamum angolense TaxID=2727404 RepID=A0AAE1WP96_9LAMI|nr:Gag-Pol polyprotein [Sesamum angolense]
MLGDAHEVVKRCRACQEHANVNHQPTALMRPLESPCPFDQWGIDLVGPLPQATGQRKFLIVVVDYFTKWVEAEPLANISEKEMIKFLWRNIVCRFGIPPAIISDNGTQFSGNKLKEWCKGLAIKQFFTSVSNPQANGQTEVTNRTILQLLKTRLALAWVDELPSILWTYRTTPRTTTGEISFSLSYGTDAVAPTEVGELNLRVKHYDLEANEQGLRMNLDFFEEVRERASVREAMYKARMAKAYNSRVRPMNFRVGDLVMRKAEASGPIGKLDSKWEGPYKVTEIVGTGAYKLQQMDGRNIPRTWNIANLKKYYSCSRPAEKVSLLAS